MTDILLIVNPASDNGATGKRWPALSCRLRSLGLEFDAGLTAYAGHAAELARAAAQEYAVVAYMGGDGTANEVANGLLAVPAETRPVLAAIPRGTGGDFPRGLGLDRSLEAAAARLRRRRARRIDVVESFFAGRTGAATERFFLNISDVGLGGRVAELVDSRSKAFGGFASFLSAILAAFWGYENHYLRLLVDGEPRFEGRAASIVVANGPFFAGGMRMAPDARMDDGLLDVIALGDVTRRDLLLNLRRLYAGRHLSHPRVSHFVGSEIEIEGQDGEEEQAGQLAGGPGPRIPLEMDGEHPGAAPFRARVVPLALEVLV